MTASGALEGWGKREDQLVHEQEPYNSEPSPAALAENDLTPVDRFYTRNHGPVPLIEPGAWALTVDGMVAGPRSLTLDELRASHREHTITATLQCAGNRRAGLLAVRDIPGEAPWRDGATSTAQWTGVRLSDVLAGAGVSPDARHVAFGAPDESQDARPPQAYGSSIPIEKALADEVLLAWTMNGEALSPLHGGPVRVIVPGYIGARSVKWLNRMTVQDAPSDSYFQAVAYRLQPPDADPHDAAAEGFALGPAALNSAILEPVHGQRLRAGRTTVRGYAYAGGGRRVARVDVSADGGATWLRADLGTDLGRWAWRRWSAIVEVSPGQVELVARAWDDTAALQPEDSAPLWNPKGYVNNSWPRITLHAGKAG